MIEKRGIMWNATKWRFAVCEDSKIEKVIS